MKFREPPRVAFIAALLMQKCTAITPYHAARVADDLTRYARQLRSIHERQCNGYKDHRGEWDQTAADRDAKRQERLRNLAGDRMTACPATVVVSFSGDPRGPSVRLMFEDNIEHAIY